MKLRQHGIPILLAITAMGCASTDQDSAYQVSSDTGAIKEKELIIRSQQDKISTLEQRLRQQDAELARVNTAGTSDAGRMDSALFPPNPKPGQCYARVLTPAQYRTADETVLVREESERVEIIPAQYETAKERVVVKEASSRLEVVPATFEKVTERVLVRPESTKIEEVPATYKTVTEQVLVTPARTEWKRGPAASFSSASNVLDTRATDTGEIMCLVEVPAVYSTVTKTVVDQPARTREVVIPAEYKTVTRTVLKTPATTREVPVPAEYGTVEVTKLVSPAKEKRIKVPAEYKTVTKRTKVSEERLEWRQVVCDVNLNRDNVIALQNALKKTGQYTGPIDGIIGPMTLSAANSYAKSKGLPGGSNYIAMEVVKSLGLNM